MGSIISAALSPLFDKLLVSFRAKWLLVIERSQHNESRMLDCIEEKSFQFGEAREYAAHGAHGKSNGQSGI